MNMNKPGLLDYTGPDSGWALWVHHEEPLEYCTSFRKRLTFIGQNKSLHEHALRRAALTYLPNEVIPSKLDTAREAYNIARRAIEPALQACYMARETAEQASQTYHTALEAYYTAWQACILARQAYDWARRDCDWLAIIAIYAPEIPHINGELDFSTYNKEHNRSEV
jgi:hypothetical protein